MTKWQKVKLGSLLERSDETLELQANTEYREITVRMWGKGVELRGTLTGADMSGSRRFVAHANQFIVSRIGAEKGAMGLVPPDLEGAVVSNDFPLFNVDDSKVLAPFLQWLARTKGFWEECSKASEGTTRIRLQEDEFVKMEIPLPPLEDQRRVVARIEELAEQIHEARTLRHQAAEEAEAFTASHISALFSDDGVWQRVENAVLPRKGSVRSGPFGSQLLHEEFTESGVAAIGTRDVQTNRFQLQGGWFVSPEKFEQFRRYQVFSGDVLCTIVGGSIGRFCVVPEDIPLAFTTKHVQALTLDSTKAEPRFVSSMLNFHRRCRESLFSKVEGSAQPSLNAGKILATSLPSPPLSEQRRIVAELDALQTKVDALKRLQAETAAELDALLPAILDKAFKGEL
jgi:type I restriction enzyme, S subunit